MSIEISDQFFQELMDVIDIEETITKNNVLDIGKIAVTEEFVSEYKEKLKEFESRTKQVQLSDFTFWISHSDHIDFNGNFFGYHAVIGYDYDDTIKRKWIEEYLTRFSGHEIESPCFVFDILERSSDLEKSKSLDNYNQLKHFLLGLGLKELSTESETYLKSEVGGQWSSVGQDTYYTSFGGYARWVRKDNSNYHWTIWKFTGAGTVGPVDEGYVMDLSKAISEASKNSY